MPIQTAPARESSEQTLTQGTNAAEVVAGAHSVAAPSRATFLRSFVHAWNGVVYAFRTQRNARVHLAAAIFAVALGIVLHLSPVEFALIALAIMAVLVAEMLNTVAEAVVDLVTSEYHPLARVAKDVAAGAVLVCAIFSVIIALLVFGPHLWPLVVRLVGAV